MDDPWNVKNVKQGYQSCMRINGVPLLPPVLSKECRKEMQYYKLLAQEVDRRINLLRSYVDVDESDDNEERTDAPELPNSEEPQSPEVSNQVIYFTKNPPASPHNIDMLTYDPKLCIALNLTVTKDITIPSNLSPNHLPKLDELPERDCEYSKQNVEEHSETPKVLDGDCPLVHQDGPSSLSCKSFTGSLCDIHTESLKECILPKLIRQRSYTVLTPSPQLLAHLERQYQNTGVDMSSISMTESRSFTNLSAKKRRIWDLESAKVKWSHMALELKNSCKIQKQPQKDSGKTTPSSTTSHKSYPLTQNNVKKLNQTTNSKISKSESASPLKNHPKVVKNKTPEKSPVPVTPVNKIAPRNVNKTLVAKKEETSHGKGTTRVSEPDDPAARVRALYEKLQQQQLEQMAKLMEKQQQEQQFLQKVFEEQNNILLKQLKTVCPASAVLEVKQAWGEGKDDPGRGPVSLSQLINNDTPQQSVTNSPISKTLTETNNYINKCNNVLKQSRDLTNNVNKACFKKSPPANSRPPSVTNKSPSVRHKSPTSARNNTSRKLNYDTSISSENADSTLTDQTNDTMADLNVTFPSDSSEPHSQIYRPVSRKNLAQRTPANRHPGSASQRSKNVLSSIPQTVHVAFSEQEVDPNAPIISPEQRAAATTIVAYAKGYLTRRLMGTERVQGIVQTIRDALLCALQLHQDREGIRGADIDLHRRLIQQITAACYTLHETFVTSTPGQRCALIAADRSRKQALSARSPLAWNSSKSDVMSKSHSGAFPSRTRRAAAPADPMTHSNYEKYLKPTPLTTSAPLPTSPPSASLKPKRTLSPTKRDLRTTLPAQGVGSGAEIHPPCHPSKDSLITVCYNEDVTNENSKSNTVLKICGVRLPRKNIRN